MNNKEKAIHLAENNLDRCFGSERDYGVTCALEMAQWKDEQLKQTREDAKSLHDEISDCIDRLVKSRLSKNGIGESNALQQMESLIVKTQQFLQTI